MQNCEKYKVYQRDKEEDRMAFPVSVFLNRIEIDKQGKGHHHSEKEAHQSVNEIYSCDKRSHLRNG